MKPRLALASAGLVVIPLAAVVLVLRLGQALHAPALANADIPAARASGAEIPSLVLLMAQVGLIVLIARAVGFVMERIGQPRVVGEVVAGLLLGPSFLGWVAPRVSASLFPPASFVSLNALSQLGLVLFMFLVGLELDIQLVRRQGRIAVLISNASITVPMVLGTSLALYLYPRYSNSGVTFPEFALFMGVAMSITAFPVLARILTDQKLLRTVVGTMALACAALNDVSGWCVLAYLVAFVRASHSSLPLWAMLAGLSAFVVVMATAGRKLLNSFERACLADGELSNDRKALLLVFLLASALVTEALGLHLLFGAFVAGAVMPKHPKLVAYLIEKFESLTVLLLVPLFFAYTGLRTNVGEIRGMAMWSSFFLIVVVAIAGKLGGAGVAARAGGFSWRESLAIGSLMNTRGLMELVVLNIGLDIGVLSPALFSMMVVMAVVTTMMTTPVLQWVYLRHAQLHMPAVTAHSLRP